tara:strand:+ start:30682 stop:31122 length:441 start_codon:yes stop_codon:yes gene_type:complete
MDLKIKRVDTSDGYKDALKIRKEVFIDEQKISEKIEIDSYEYSSNYIIALLNGKPVATARWRSVGSEIKLERFAVKMKFRNKGIGQKMNKFILDIIPNDKVIYLNSQESAIGFYEKIGFFVSGPPFKEAGIVHKKMIYKRNDKTKA